MAAPMKEDTWVLRARQLQRFYAQEPAHAFKDLITDADLRRAKVLAPDSSKQTDEEEDWPENWSKTKNSLRTLLSKAHWKALPEYSSVVADAERAEPDAAPEGPPGGESDHLETAEAAITTTSNDFNNPDSSKSVTASPRDQDDSTAKTRAASAQTPLPSQTSLPGHTLLPGFSAPTFSSLSRRQLANPSLRHIGPYGNKRRISLSYPDLQGAMASRHGFSAGPPAALSPVRTGSATFGPHTEVDWSQPAEQGYRPLVAGEEADEEVVVEVARNHRQGRRGDEFSWEEVKKCLEHIKRERRKKVKE